MKQNIDKLLDRDVALTNLVTRADDLQTSATSYNQTTKQLRRKYWWKNAKVFLKKVSSYLLLFIVLDKRLHCWYYHYRGAYYYL
jgi:vesicle-associated membrane protein 7